VWLAVVLGVLLSVCGCGIGCSVCCVLGAGVLVLGMWRVAFGVCLCHWLGGAVSLAVVLGVWLSHWLWRLLCPSACVLGAWRVAFGWFDQSVDRASNW